MQREKAPNNHNICINTADLYRLHWLVVAISTSYQRQSDSHSKAQHRHLTLLLTRATRHRIFASLGISLQPMLEMEWSTLRAGLTRIMTATDQWHHRPSAKSHFYTNFPYNILVPTTAFPITFLFFLYWILLLKVPACECPAWMKLPKRLACTTLNWSLWTSGRRTVLLQSESGPSASAVNSRRLTSAGGKCFPGTLQGVDGFMVMCIWKRLNCLINKGLTDIIQEPINFGCSSVICNCWTFVWLQSRKVLDLCLS